MSKLTKEISVNPPNNWKRKGNKSTNKQSHYQPEILEEPTPNKFTYSVQDVLSLRKATSFSYDQDISEFQEVISKESLLPVLQDGRAMKEHQDALEGVGKYANYYKKNNSNNNTKNPNSPWRLKKNENQKKDVEELEKKVNKKSEESWYYIGSDNQTVNGPFSSAKMMEWFKRGFFTGSLLLKKQSQSEFITLLDYFTNLGRNPFEDDLPPNLPVEPVATQPESNQTDFRIQSPGPSNLGNFNQSNDGNYSMENVFLSRFGNASPVPSPSTSVPPIGFIPNAPSHWNPPRNYPATSPNQIPAYVQSPSHTLPSPPTWAGWPNNSIPFLPNSPLPAGYPMQMPGTHAFPMVPLQTPMNIPPSSIYNVPLNFVSQSQHPTSYPEQSPTPVIPPTAVPPTVVPVDVPIQPTSEPAQLKEDPAPQSTSKSNAQPAENTAALSQTKSTPQPIPSPQLTQSQKKNKKKKKKQNNNQTETQAAPIKDNQPQPVQQNVTKGGAPVATNQQANKNPQKSQQQNSGSNNQQKSNQQQNKNKKNQTQPAPVAEPEDFQTIPKKVKAKNKISQTQPINEIEVYEEEPQPKLTRKQLKRIQEEEEAARLTKRPDDKIYLTADGHLTLQINEVREVKAPATWNKPAVASVTVNKPSTAIDKSKQSSNNQPQKKTLRQIQEEEKMQREVERKRNEQLKKEQLAQAKLIEQQKPGWNKNAAQKASLSLQEIQQQELLRQQQLEASKLREAEKMRSSQDKIVPPTWSNSVIRIEPVATPKKSLLQIQQEELARKKQQQQAQQKTKAAVPGVGAWNSWAGGSPIPNKEALDSPAPSVNPPTPSKKEDSEEEDDAELFWDAPKAATPKREEPKEPEDELDSDLRTWCKSQLISLLISSKQDEFINKLLRCNTQSQVNDLIQETCGISKSAKNFATEFWKRFIFLKQIKNEVPVAQQQKNTNQQQNKPLSKSAKRKQKMKKVNAAEILSFGSNFEGRSLEHP